MIFFICYLDFVYSKNKANYVPLAACFFILGSESVYFIFEANTTCKINLCFITISTINLIKKFHTI